MLEVSKGELVVGVRDELPNETRASSARRLVELDCRAPGAEQRSIESSHPLGLVWASWPGAPVSAAASMLHAVARKSGEGRACKPCTAGSLSASTARPFVKQYQVLWCTCSVPAP